MFVLPPFEVLVDALLQVGIVAIILFALIALPYLILGTAFSGNNLLLMTGILIAIMLLSAGIQRLAQRRAPPEEIEALPAAK